MQGTQVWSLVSELRSHMPQRNWAWEPQRESPCVTTQDPIRCNETQLRPNAVKTKHNQADAHDFQCLIWIFWICWLSPSWYNIDYSQWMYWFDWYQFQLIYLTMEQHSAKNLQHKTSQTTIDTFTAPSHTLHKSLCISVMFFVFGAGGEGDDRGWDGWWHHWLDGHESQWTPGVGDGQGGLACCDSWGRKESDMTERLIWSDLCFLLSFSH